MKPHIPPKGSKIVVAMSGGVDSSVVAAMLVEQGYNVVGMMLRLWNDNACDAENRCCTPESLAEARRIAGKYGFPFYAIDAKQSFYNSVVKNFIAGYSAGITPNPCLVCNSTVRWKILLDEATAIGAQYLATGHYAKLFMDSSNRVHLAKGDDSTKDQAYVLSFLPQDYLARTYLPLGDTSKTQVRELARKYELRVAEKPDSQDLCFLGANSLQDFLNRHAPKALLPGKITLQNGEVLGKHTGLSMYTIGQRKGIGVAAARPLYVLKKDLLSNTLVVGYEEELGCVSFMVHSPRWICEQPSQFPFSCEVKTRYKAPPVRCDVHCVNENLLRVVLSSSVRDITAGQGAVFYSNNEVLGCGIIDINTN